MATPPPPSPAPLARDIMTDVLTRDPVNRVEPQGQKMADRT